jgi:hypothetical protein
VYCRPQGSHFQLGGWLVGPERLVVMCGCVASVEAGANTAKKSSLAGLTDPDWLYTCECCPLQRLV